MGEIGETTFQIMHNTHRLYPTTLEIQGEIRHIDQETQIDLKIRLNPVIIFAPLVIMLLVGQIWFGVFEYRLLFLTILLVAMVAMYIGFVVQFRNEAARVKTKLEELFDIS